jgi:hypothetical protein
MACGLAAQRYGIAFHAYRDAHNWVAWRDSVDPPLLELISKACG